MEQLELDLRDQLARQVAVAPSTGHLADVAVRRGRRTRRRQAVATSLAAVAAVAAAAAVGLPERSPEPFAGLGGPPRVPLVVHQGTPEVLDWPDGGQVRSRLSGEVPGPLADTPSGLLMVEGDRLLLLRADAEEPEVVLSGLERGVAVAPGGDRVTVLRDDDGRRSLLEVRLPTGEVLRALPLVAPTFPPEEDVVPVAYSGDDVLLTGADGTGESHALRWEPGDSGVLARLDGYDGTLGGSAGRGAFGVGSGDRCRTEVAELRTGGRGWQLCREPFVGFSPDGRWVLATDATLTGLVVRDARDGALVRRFPVPGGLRAYGWESPDAVLHTTVEGGRTAVVRCSVDRGACATAVDFADLFRIPQPVPPA